MEEYIIRFIDLPCTINGFTVQDTNGFYNIYINSRLSSEAQKKVIKHELSHIKRNDFCSFDKIEVVERI